MKNLRIGFVLSIIAILCFLFMGTGKAISAEKTIRLGSPFKTGHILVDAAEKFKELVEKESGGRKKETPTELKKKARDQYAPFVNESVNVLLDMVTLGRDKNIDKSKEPGQISR